MTRSKFLFCCPSQAFLVACWQGYSKGTDKNGLGESTFRELVAGSRRRSCEAESFLLEVIFACQ